MNVMRHVMAATMVLTILPFKASMSQETRPPSAQASTLAVTVDEPRHGSIGVDPPLPSHGTYAAGTVLTLTATPEPGFVVDALYYAVPGPWGLMYFDTPSVTTLDVTVDQDMHVGAYFVEESAVEGFTVTADVVYATPGVKPLKYDVYAPEGAENLPCIVIVHGGGWRSNDEDIMRGMARQLAQGGKYVVFSIDYRWIGTLDGDERPNAMADLIGDVYGALAHIREHARDYGGDPTRIAVTGDSAGGHLSAAAATMAHMIGDGGFGTTPGVYEYMPTYVPSDKTVEQVRADMMAAIRAAAPSYGVFAFSGSQMLQFLEMDSTDVAGIRAVSPIHNIPKASERPIPHYLTRGTLDPLIHDADVGAYLQALVAAGQAAEYVQIGGASHAFFDWKPDVVTEATFRRYGVFYVEEMEHFFDSVFYADE
jgi:acetyl esterase/lipase